MALLYYERKFSISILAIVIVSIFGSPVFGQDSDPESLYQEAINLINLGKYQEAIELFDKILEIVPEHENSLNNKGAALLKLEKFEEAIEFFDDILQIYPKNEDVMNNMGIALIELERYEEAIDLYNRILEINPDNLAAIDNRRIAFEAIGIEYIKNSKFIAYVQIEIRNSQGNLVGYLESDVIKYLPHSLTDEFLDSYPVKEVVSKKDQSYEVRKILKTQYIEKDDFVGATILQSHDTKPYFTLFFAAHHGITLEKGDTVKVLWTILRAID